MIRLTSSDVFNGVCVGEIHEYIITDQNSDDPRRGDLIQARILAKNTIFIQNTTKFFEKQSRYGFVNAGSFVYFTEGIVKRDLSAPYPSLRFGLRNLGEKEIIGVRAWINGELLPSTFGVSQIEPILPWGSLSASQYTAWYDPETGNNTGFYPVDGEEYRIKVEVKLEDYKVQRFTKTQVYDKETKMGSICFMVSSDEVPICSSSLISHGLDKDGTISLSFRNTWSSISNNEWNATHPPITPSHRVTLNSTESDYISRLEVFIDDVLIMQNTVHIEKGHYFGVTAKVPFNLIPHEDYSVKLVAYSSKGVETETVWSVRCEYYSLG